MTDEPASPSSGFVSDEALTDLQIPRAAEWTFMPIVETQQQTKKEKDNV